MKNSLDHIKTILDIHTESYLCAQKLFKGVYLSTIFDFDGNYLYTVEVETDEGVISGVFHCNDLKEVEKVKKTVEDLLVKKHVKVYKTYSEWKRAIEKRDKTVDKAVDKTVKNIRNGNLNDFSIFVATIAPREIMHRSFGEENADRFIDIVKECALSGGRQRIRKFFNEFSTHILEDYLR